VVPANHVLVRATCLTSAPRRTRRGGRRARSWQTLSSRTATFYIGNRLELIQCKQKSPGRGLLFARLTHSVQWMRKTPDSPDGSSGVFHYLWHLDLHPSAFGRLIIHPFRAVVNGHRCRFRTNIASKIAPSSGAILQLRNPAWAYRRMAGWLR
jgi:hypothetical protein